MLLMHHTCVLVEKGGGVNITYSDISSYLHALEYFNLISVPQLYDAHSALMSTGNRQHAWYHIYEG